MIRLTLIIDDLGLGGAQRQMVELAKALPKDRYAVHVIALSVEKTDYESELREHGISLTLIAQKGKFSWPALRQLTEALREQKPQIVHTWLFTADLYGRIAARRVRARRIICTVRSVEPWKPRHYVWADRWLRRCTDAYVVNADIIASVIAKRDWVKPERITTIYNGLDLNVFDPSKARPVLHEQLGLPADVPLVGVVGRLAKEKNQAMLVRAAVHVDKVRYNAHFCLIGDGPERSNLEALAEELGVADRIHFVPSSRDVRDIFASLRIAVVTSFYEGCCNVLLEAMAMRCAVIATDVGGNPELVREGENGRLVMIEDTEALTETIERMLDRPEDLRRMGENGRRKVEERFSLERMVGDTMALYERLMR